MQSSQTLDLVMMGVINSPLWSANKRLMADRYSLPIRDYWQTIHKICKHSAIFFLLADPWSSVQKSTITALFKRLQQTYFISNIFSERSANNLLNGRQLRSANKYFHNFTHDVGLGDINTKLTR